MSEYDRASILVVDDTADSVTFVEEALDEEKYHVRSALDGELALAAVQEEPPDLILLNTGMAHQDAYWVARGLKADERTRDIPVIFLSERGRVSDKDQAYAEGGVDLITKPFHVDEMLASVETQLALRRLQQKLKESDAQLVRVSEGLVRAEGELARANEQLEREMDQHRQAEQDLQLQAERLEIRREIEQSILAARLPETIAVAAISRIRRLIPFRHAIVLAIGESGELEMLASESYGGSGLPVDVSLYQEVLQDPVLKRGLVQGVADLASLRHRSPLREGLYAAGVCSYVVAPLFIQGELIGTLHMESSGAQAFSTGHVTIAAEVAASLAVAIRQARLYAQSQREVAERIESEWQLRQQKDLLESTIESLTYPFYVINVADYSVDLANTASRRRSRNPEATTCYALCYQHDQPCEGVAYPCPLQQVVQTGKPVTLEHTYRDVNGETRHLEVHGYPLFDEAGNVVRMIEYSRDITERKQMEEASREAAATAERERLARDLHDSVTQALFSATLVADVLPQVWERDPEGALQGVAELGYLTRGALAEMRSLLLELRPAALLESSLDELLRQLATAVTGRVQILVTLDVEPIPLLPADVHLTFYRVAQEALHNVAKHAQAGRLTASLHASPPYSAGRAGDWQGELRLEIVDDGRGFDPEQASAGQLGLGIMRERAEAVGATLVIESQPGQGTHVTLTHRS